MRTIGIDIGTSSVKAVLCRIGSEVVVERTVGKPYDEDGRPTRDPYLWARLAEAALAELRACGPVAAVGFTGQMHALVTLDSAGAVVAPVKLWLDMDGAPALESFVRRVYAGSAAAMARDTGNIPLPDFTLAKWLHAARADPSLAGRVARLCCAKDFVRQLLDTKAPHVVDRNEAAGTQLYDPFADCWHCGLVAAAGVPPEALPGVVEAATVAGRLADGTPLVVGVGDQASAARAIGAFEPGTVSLSLGTSGVLSFTLERQSLPADWDGAFHLFPLGFTGHYEVIGTIPGFGPTLSWLSTLLGRSIDEIDRLAAETAAGDARAIFLPYLAGAGAPHPRHELQGRLLGITAGLSAGRLVRAVYDGLAQELATIVHEATAIGATARRVVVSGGSARLACLVGTIAAFLDGEISVVDAAEASAVGAALIASDWLAPGAPGRLAATPLQSPEHVTPTTAWREAREAVLAKPVPDIGPPYDPRRNDALA